MELEYEEIDLGPVDGIDGTDGQEIELQASSTHLQWRYKGTTTWMDVIALDSIKGPQGIQGPDGKKLMVQKTSTHLQYKYEGESEWVNWVALSDITGPIGLPGAKGDAGSQFRYGQGIPDAALLSPGDSYVDTSSKQWDIYYKSSATKWNKMGYLKGEAGGLGGDTVPVGTMMHYTGTLIQDGWILCDGRALIRADYVELFAVIGTKYGVGDGSTTFNIPDEPNPISYIPSNSGGTQLITHDPALQVIIKAKQVVPVIASVVDNLTSESQTDALSAKQGKVLNDKVIDLKGTMVNIDENNMALFAFDGTTKYYAGGYSRRYAYLDCIGDRIFVDFNLQINTNGDLSKAPDDAVLYVQVNGLPDYVTNRVVPTAGYNLNLPALYSQINIGLAKVNNVTHIALTKSGTSAYASLTKADIKANTAILGGIDYRKRGN